ncbi:CBASS cGAMP synthase [uncultured Flavobacterium sp.]|uniref:CBASS cGAMP synthase n=1 Tax=uncultured Flavobacterium sp. TaxID=165435 RepID=UPI0025917F84|nr:CBASS cGAMP synthase [uncultured Flavobacterium sp.]
MANCHEQFVDFNSTITLTKDRKKKLKTSRTNLRNRVRDDFKTNHKDEIQPKFTSQGSSEMKTTINPIVRTVDEDGDKKSITKYDTDDGIYFIGSLEDRKSVQTYHNWIKDAVDGYTTIPPIDKNTCVRTSFADGHHIDQPIYFVEEDNDSCPQLAHKKNGWIDSDPKEFTEWFNKQANKNEQLRCIVKYLKSWSDYQNFNDGTNKMPSGFVLTIWAANNFSSNDRDDLALKNTLQNMYNSLSSNFECLRPSAPKNENVVESYSYETYFMDKLEKFLDSAKQAINETNQKNACFKWQKHLGSRFSCSTAKDEDEGAKSHSQAAVISSNAKSA